VNKLRVLLVDDHQIVRLGLAALINSQANMTVVGEAGNAQEALGLVERLAPDVVLMDIRMPGESGIEATQKITRQFPKSRVIILTSYSDDEWLMRAICAGAAGYVLKEVGNEPLLQAIAAAGRGDALLDTATTARLLSQVRASAQHAEAETFRELAGRELDVLAHVARGKTNVEIGRLLNLSEKTVRNYVSHILRKLQLTNRVELAAYALEHHFFDRFKKG
jgi:two-component system, NarL family, response regulator DevR